MCTKILKKYITVLLKQFAKQHTLQRLNKKQKQELSPSSAAASASITAHGVV